MPPIVRVITPKQAILSVLTLGVLVLVGYSLLVSWHQPQVQNRLELYQTNLQLQAAEFQPELVDDGNADKGKSWFGQPLFADALKQYRAARQSAQESLQETRDRLQVVKAEANAAIPEDASIFQPLQSEAELQSAIQRLNQRLNDLDLRLGLLQVKDSKVSEALTTWEEVRDRALGQPEAVAEFPATAEVLIGMWSEPPRLLPDAEPQIQQALEGWFRYRALQQVYQLQQRQDALDALQVEEQGIAQQTAIKLFVLGSIPMVGGAIGVGLGIFIIVQRVLGGENSLLARNGNRRWNVPWDAEIVWQVLVVGFFLVGQLIVPIAFQLLGFGLVPGNARLQALYFFSSYVLVAAGGLLVLYLSLKPFLPFPSSDWFRFEWAKPRWVLWGVGGYLVALPLVLIVSLLNQQIWQGQGGSNPILPIALENRDGLALGIFFLTASVAAPLFEEVLFRGFLLPSLTRYMSVWGAIAASSLLFALAHLSVSEVLPLATLGTILGIVYTRSRNLLAPILLHSLWNSGTMLSLFILGSGT